MADNSPPLKTRQRLLITASRIFAEKGYQDATIAEICEQAGTNIASVNYHFGDKENLYLEAWRYAFKQDLKAHPSDGGVDQETSAEHRLKGAHPVTNCPYCRPQLTFFCHSP
jgi:AcrR family transcriptional regulator